MYLSAVSTIPSGDRRRSQVRLESYVFGFNGQYKDDEVYGEGNAYEFEFRTYDPRIARFLSVDPLYREYPFYSPYQFAGNTPIMAVDLEGKEPKVTIQKYSESISQGRTQISLTASIDVKVYIINKSSMNLNINPIALSNYTNKAVSGSGKYQGSLVMKYNGTGTYSNQNISLSSDITFNATYINVKSESEIGDYDFAVALVDKIPVQKAGGIDPVGLAIREGNVSLVEATWSNEIYNIIVHEFLHNLGLADKYKVKNGVVIDNGGDNIMGSGSSWKITPEQKGEIANSLLSVFGAQKYQKDSNSTTYGKKTREKLSSYIKETKSSVSK